MKKCIVQKIIKNLLNKLLKEKNVIEKLDKLDYYIYLTKKIVEVLEKISKRISDNEVTDEEIETTIKDVEKLIKDFNT